MTKADIVREAARLGLDAGMSWSCYDPAPGGVHCGLCDSCRLRAKGFEEAGLPDPTRLRDAADAMSYAVKEMFLTLQGEGVNAGRRAVFVRFAGCNLWSGREQDRATRGLPLLRYRFRRHRWRGRRHASPMPTRWPTRSPGHWGEGSERALRRADRRRADAAGRRCAGRCAPCRAASRSRSRATARSPAHPGHRLGVHQPQGGQRGGPALGRRTEAGLAAAGHRYRCDRELGLRPFPGPADGRAPRPRANQRGRDRIGAGRGRNGG